MAATAISTVGCSCGAVQLEFDSCTAADAFVNKKGGQPPPLLNECADSIWFGKGFRVIKGEDKIAGHYSTRYHCKECSNVILADHIAYPYAGKLIMTPLPPPLSRLSSSLCSDASEDSGSVVSDEQLTSRLGGDASDDGSTPGSVSDQQLRSSVESFSSIASDDSAGAELME